MPNTPRDLRGLKVLIVEDEPVIQMDIATAAAQLGCWVITARSLQGAFVIESKYDFEVALLDVRLNDGDVFPFAERLCNNRVPVGFITGNPSLIDPNEYGNRPRITKPFTDADVEQLLRQLASEV